MAKWCDYNDNNNKAPSLNQCLVCVCVHPLRRKQSSWKATEKCHIKLMPFDSLTTGVSVFSPPWGKVLVMRIMTGILTLVRALPSASLHLDTLSRGSGGRKLGEARKIFDVLSIMANYFLFFFHLQFPGRVLHISPPSLFHKDRLRLMWQQDESNY